MVAREIEMLTIVVCATTALILVALLLHYSRQTSDVSQKNKGKRKWTRLIKLNHWLVFICILFYVINVLFVALLYLKLFKTDEACDIVRGFTILWYHLAKTCIYAVFLNRLIIIYDESAFQYSFKTVMLPLYGLLLVYLIVGMVGDFVAINGTYDASSGVCDLQFELWGVAFTFLMDLVFSGACVYLFVKPLFVLSYRQKSTFVLNVIQQSKPDHLEQNRSTSVSSPKRSPRPPRRVDKKFRYLIKKSCVLVCTAILSTLLFLVAWAVVGQLPGEAGSIWDRLALLLVCIDNIINSGCLVLIQASNDWLFEKIFGCCVSKNNPPGLTQEKTSVKKNASSEENAQNKGKETEAL